MNCTCVNKKQVHSILTAAFPDLITKSIKIGKPKPGTGDDNPEHVIVTMEEEVFLFDFKEFEFDKEKTVDSKLKKCCHAWTYLYFTLVVILAAIWAALVGIENAVYRKTTTCNDINVQDESFTCFDAKQYESYPCRASTGGPTSESNVPVICYLFSPSIGALGIAFSIFKLVLFGVTVYFKIAVKIVELGSWTKYLVYVTQVILFIVITVGIISVYPSIHFTNTFSFYFFHGNAVIRLAMFCLLIMTPAVVIFVPLCGFTSEHKMRNTVLERKQKRTSPPTRERRPGSEPVHRPGSEPAADQEANLSADQGANLSADQGANLSADQGANLSVDQGAHQSADHCLTQEQRGEFV